MFIANNPWENSEHSTDYPLRGVQLLMGIAPPTKSWLQPFSLIKQIETSYSAKTGKPFKLYSLEWEVANVTDNDGHPINKNGMLYINRNKTQDGLKLMTET